MPLLRKKEFEKIAEPVFLRDDEEVFHCKVTNEIFRNYDDFCQRIILVNSMIWSCSMTGKTNLTYAEALQSEEMAKKSVTDFPVELRLPVLYLATKTKRMVINDMSDDVFAFVKDRYFVGEIVESSFTENNWQESYVLQVIAPTEKQIKAQTITNGKSPDRTFTPAANLYRYEVEQLDADDQDSSHVMILQADHVRRKKGPYTKDKNRVFLKQFIEIDEHGFVVVKESVKQKYKLDTIRFGKIFDGPLPEFEQSKKVVNGKKVQRQETLTKFFEKSTNGVHDGKSLLEEMKRKEEEHKRREEEYKQKILEERQRRKEEHMKVLTYVKEWNKPRDDLELENQKELPVGVKVESRIPAKYFGDALMIQEFVNSFASLVSTKDFFPGGLTIDLLERALLEKEITGPLTDILQMLLITIFNVQDDEAVEHKKSQTRKDFNTDDEFESVSLSEATHLATLAFNWSPAHQGVSLSRLPICPVTLTEVLRLHFLSSGARLNEAATKWRYQQRGGYTSEDDPGLAIRIKHPHILKTLALHNVNQLPINDKLTILTCLIDQLLTYADVRDVIEERMEKKRKLTTDLKVFQQTEKRQEQEYASARLKINREHKGQANLIQTELEKLETEMEKKRNDLEKQNRRLCKALNNLQTVLGSDRAYQRYVKIESLPGLFVENDERNLGRCLDKIVKQVPELINANEADTIKYLKKQYGTCNGSDKENENGIEEDDEEMEEDSKNKLNGLSNPARKLLMCTANYKSCPVHSNKTSKSIWSFYHNKDDLQDLINNLNKRGVRESELRQVLETQREHLEDLVMETNVLKLNPTLDVQANDDKDEKPVNAKIRNMYARYGDTNLGFPADVNLSDAMHMTLVDNILEMEEKLYNGGLGHMKVKDRVHWRNNLNFDRYSDIEKEFIKKEEHPKFEQLKIEGRSSRPGTPDIKYKDPGYYLRSTAPDLDYSDDSDTEMDRKQLLAPTDNQQQAIRILSIALIQIAESINPKHLLRPLGNVQVKPKLNEHDVLEKWEQSLLASTSYSQVFLHYCTLDNCVTWGQSALVARCSVCRRAKDPESMLLCDECNKGYHLYCLKPKLTSIPKGQWYCPKCTPKEPSPKKTRKIFRDESEDEENDEEDVQEMEVEEIKSTIIKTETTLIEVCEECGTGGHVICCDYCPKVYHLECTQPQLRRVPRGEWKCHKCTRKNEKDNKESDSSSGEDTPTAQRRSKRTTNEHKPEKDDLLLHNVALQELLSDVVRHKDSWPFTRPVTKHEVPDYYDIISRPMDFGKIKYKLNMGDYRSDNDVMDDAALVFENCDTYNNSEADVYKCGVRLLKFFEKRARELGFKFPDGLMGTSFDDDEKSGPTRPKRSRHQ